MDKNKKFANMPKLPMDAQLLLIPMGSLLLLGILFLVLFKIGFGRLNIQKNEIKLLTKNIQVLKSRQEILSKIEAKLEENSKFFGTIFPEENPTLIVFSQLKNTASLMGVVSSNFKSTGEADSGDMKKTSISFDLLGDLNGIFMYINNLQNLAPVIVLDRIRVGGFEEGVGASVTISTFWAESINKLPPITEPVKDLTSQEEEVIAKIVGLDQPSFFQVEPSGSTGRTEPF